MVQLSLKQVSLVINVQEMELLKQLQVLTR